MRSSIASVFLLPVLGACASTADYHAVSEQRAASEQPVLSQALSPALSASAGPQDTDYSLTSLYLNAHGDFQHKGRPHLFLHKADPFHAPLRASFRYQGQSEIEGERGDLQWQQYNVNALFPIAVDQDVALLVGGNYEIRDYDFDTIAGATQDDRYHRIDLQLGGTWFVHDELSITGLFLPGIYSDLDGTLNHNDYYFHGSLLGTYRASESLFYKVGVAADETFDDVPVFPLLGLSYVMAPEWRIDVLLPWAATVSWQAAETTTVAAGLGLEGAAYNIRSSHSTGKIQTENRIQELTLFLEVDHQFTDQVSAFGRFGTLLAGDYDIRTDLPVGSASDGNIEPALFFEVGLGWKF